MEKTKLLRFERVKFKNAGPLRGRNGSRGAHGMVMKVFDKVDGPFTAASLEELAVASGVPVPVRASTLATLRRLKRIGLIRLLESEPGKSPVYEKMLLKTI